MALHLIKDCFLFNPFFASGAGVRLPLTPLPPYPFFSINLFVKVWCFKMRLVALIILVPVRPSNSATVSSYEGFEFCIRKMRFVALIIFVPARPSYSATVSRLRSVDVHRFMESFWLGYGVEEFQGELVGHGFEALLCRCPSVQGEFLAWLRCRGLVVYTCPSFHR